MRFAVVHPSVHSNNPDAARGVTLGLWFVGCLARHSSVVIYAGFEFCVWEHWYPVCVCCDLCYTTSIDSVGHAPAAAEYLQ